MFCFASVTGANFFLIILILFSMSIRGKKKEFADKANPLNGK